MSKNHKPRPAWQPPTAEPVDAAEAIEPDVIEPETIEPEAVGNVETVPAPAEPDAEPLRAELPRSPDRTNEPVPETVPQMREHIDRLSPYQLGACIGKLDRAIAQAEAAKDEASTGTLYAMREELAARLEGRP